MYTKNLITATCVALSASLAVAQTAPGTQSSGAVNSAPSNQNQAAPNNQAQQNPAGVTGQAAQNTQATEQDKQFVKKALTSTMVEMQSSQMATQKAESPEVQQTAQQLAQDHAQVGQAIQQVAQAKNIDTPESLDTKQQQKLSKLNETQEGQAFEKEYVKATVKGHEESIQLFQQASQQVQDPHLKQVISQALPLLQRHAQQIAQLPGAREQMKNPQSATPGQAQPSGQPGAAQQPAGQTSQQPTTQPGATSAQQPTYTGQQPTSQGNI